MIYSTTSAEYRRFVCCLEPPVCDRRIRIHRQQLCQYAHLFTRLHQRDRLCMIQDLQRQGVERNPITEAAIICIHIALGCRFCEDSLNTRTCGQCRAARYCSSECQYADWGDHRIVCRPIHRYRETDQDEFLRDVYRYCRFDVQQELHYVRYHGTRDLINVVFLQYGSIGDAALDEDYTRRLRLAWIT